MTSPSTTPAQKRYRVFLTEKLHYTFDVLATDEDEARELALETEYRSEPECSFFDAENIEVVADDDKDFDAFNACVRCGLRGDDDPAYPHCPACIEKIKTKA